MLSGHSFNPSLPDPSQLQQLGKSLITAKPAEQRINEQNRESTSTASVEWLKIESEDGELKLTAVPNTYQVDVTSVSIRPDQVAAPRTVNFFGFKIDISQKLDEFKESYVKNYALSKSHNLMVARFAQLKVACLGQLLSVLGCATDEIRQLQKKAMGEAIRQNKALFDENEYNGELLAIVGGGPKQVRQQQRVIGEIRKQLIAQANNLGLPDYYTRERVVQTQITQCQKILQKFQEEKLNLQYQLSYMGEN